MPIADRHFLVERYGPRVVIREVPFKPGSHRLSRTEAWARATVKVKGHPRSQNPFHRKRADVVMFVGLDMSEKQLNLRDFIPAPEKLAETPTPVMMSDTPMTPVAAPEPAPSVDADLLKALTS